MKHLDRFFTGWRLASIDPAGARRYVLRRQAQGAANGTINRELAVLGRMLRLAYEGGTLWRLPVIRKLKEALPRQGFFEPAAFDAVRRELRPDLQVAVALAYTLGWRMQSEVLRLEVPQVEARAGSLRLDPGQAKNEQGRLVFLPADLKPLVAAQVERVRGLERQLGRIVPYPSSRISEAATGGPGSRTSAGRGRAPAAAPAWGRCSGTTCGARSFGIWYTWGSRSAWPWS